MGFAVQLEAPSSEAIRRLSRFGILHDDVKYVGTSMVQAAVSANPLGPRAEAGNLRYARGISAWAEALIPRGWKREWPDGCELITSPDDSMSICVTAGDHNVGMMTDPKARYPRGTATKERIHVNQEQLGMASILGRPQKRSTSVPTLWIMLHNSVHDRLYLELSLPSKIEGDSRRISWQERLRLGIYGWVNELPGTLRTDDQPQNPSGPIIKIRPK